MVSLPKNWVEKRGLKKGSSVVIEETRDGSLLVYPDSSQKLVNEIQINYISKQRESLLTQIIGAYLLGYDLIKITAEKRILFEDREIIKETIRKLVGLEVVEEDVSKIVAQFLPEASSIDPERMLRMMSNIAVSMVDDVITSMVELDYNLAKIVMQRDEELDRLYFLIVRVVRGAVASPRLGKKLAIDPVRCMDYRLASKLVESIGDEAVKLASNVQNLKSIPKGLQERMREIKLILNQCQKYAVDAFIEGNNFKAKRALEMSNRLKDGLLSLELSLATRGEAGILLPQLSSISRIVGLIADVADLATPPLST